MTPRPYVENTGIVGGTDNECFVNYEWVGCPTKSVMGGCAAMAVRVPEALTADDLRVIRLQLRRGVSQTAIASAFSIPRTVVARIAKRHARIFAAGGRRA